MALRLHVVLATLMLLVVQTVVATPSRAMAGLRAAACCANCRHPGSLRDAMRCCGVRVGDDLAVTPHAGKPLVPTFAVHALCASLSVPSEVLAARFTQQTPPRDRPPPVFLLVRSLRL